MKKTYYLPQTDIIQYVALKSIMDATTINGNNIGIDPGDGPVDPSDPGALMM